MADDRLLAAIKKAAVASLREVAAKSIDVAVFCCLLALYAAFRGPLEWQLLAFTAIVYPFIATAINRLFARAKL